MTTTELTKIQEQACAELAIHIKENAYSSLAPSTRLIYRSDFYIFTQWCERMGLSRCPASPETVAGFITAQDLEGIKPATLIRRLAAIKKAHEAYKYPTPTSDALVRAVMKGIKRNRGTAPAKKAAATAERLEQMVSYCIPTTLGVRDKAILLLGFAGAFRRSELVSLTMKDIERTPEGIKVTIRKSKGDQEGKGQTIPILNGTRFRVVDNLFIWLQQAGIKDGLVFRSVLKNGKVQNKPLSPRDVARIVKKYAGYAGFSKETFAGHSLRAGFITSGANAGADIYKLMEVSRHKKPETVMGYVRESKLFENHAGAKFL